MQYETIIVGVIAVVVVIAVIYWRSKRQEIAARPRSPLPRPTRDVLDSERAEDPRVEPELKADAQKGAKSAKAAAGAKSSFMPSEEPPIYDELEREENERKAQAETEAERRSSSDSARQAPEADRLEDRRSYPPVDAQIEWVLDISPKEGKHFSVGGIQSLAVEVKRLALPLRVRIWAKSAKDGLYYQADELPANATHVVAALALANRTTALDEVRASAFYQVLEQSAAQNDVEVRRELEPQDAVQRSKSLRDFITYYDSQVDVLIEPTDPETPFTVALVDGIARASGFRAASGCWELRACEGDHDPIISLAFGPEGTKNLTLSYDVPLASLSRGDLQLFFRLANHLACELHAAWSDCSREPIDAGGALLIEEQVAAHDALMAKNGVGAGSERAKLLFARGA